jgi:uncharacterized protein YcbK (DUF882 family)
MSFGDLSPNFSRREFRCKDGSEHPINPVLLGMLEAIRAKFEAPITIISGYRSPAHNAKVGGAKNSKHVTGEAADIRVEGIPPAHVHYWASRYFSSGGIGLYKTWVHVDCRPTRARWGRG